MFPSSVVYLHSDVRHKRVADMTTIVRFTAQELIEAALSENTRRAYAKWLRRYMEWARANGANPATLQAIGGYLAALAEQGYKASAIAQAAAALRLWARAQGLEAQTEPLRLLLRGIRRKIGAAVRQKRPLTVEIFERIPWRRGIIGLRDRALLAVGLAGALRLRELVALNLEDVEEEKEQGYVITIRRSKTDQEGTGRQVAIPFGGRLRAGEALRAWLEVRRQWGETGALFTGFRYRKPAGRVTATAVQRLIKRYVAALGLDPNEFSGHSLRAGFVTSAALRNASESAIAAQTGHRSVAVLRRYIRRATIWQHNAVLML